MFHVFVLVACLTVVNAGYNHQYFYTGLPSQQYQQVPQYQPYQYQPYQQQYQAPVTYQSFIPQQHYVPQVQTYNAFPAFPTPHNFGYQHQQQFYYHTQAPTPGPIEGQKGVTTTGSVETATTETTEEVTPTTTTTAQPPKTEETTPEYDEVEQDDESVITNAAFRTAQPQANNLLLPANPNPYPNPIPIAQNDNFRGFAYRNEFEGGRSHFVFITGPEANRFPGSQPLTTPEVSSRTSASDAVDSVATSSKPSNDHSLDALLQYLENPQVGVQRFYSINNALVSRRIEDEIPALPTLPSYASHQFANARTALPIVQPISPLFPILRSSFQLDALTVKPSETTTEIRKEEKKEKEEQDDKEKHEVSASNIVEAKSVAPEVETSSVAATTTTTTAPASTTVMAVEASSTTTTTTTTEKVETSSSAKKEEEKSTMGTIIVE